MLCLERLIVVIIILPLAPVVLVALLLLMALGGWVQSGIDTIVTLIWILLMVSSIGLIIYNIKSDLSDGAKIFGIITSIVIMILTIFESRIFLGALKDPTVGPLGFAAFAIVGGIFWFLPISLNLYAGLVCGDSSEYEEFRYIKTIGLIVAGVVLSNIFGMFG